ncbi:MAG: nucleoside deaminase [Pigmentiphaga sp.]|nr:nucleoside deaminase [Pigmentiphaga sp.]
MGAFFLQACSCAAGLLAAEVSSASAAGSASTTSGTNLPPSRASWLPGMPRERHETAMHEAIVMARRNPRYPFGAVITDRDSGEILARGVNDGGTNPILHGEIDCLNRYVAEHGNRDWDRRILYTTGEPCPMCMSALAWAGIAGVVYASSIATLRAAGIPQIMIGAAEVAAAANFYHGELLGGILAEHTDPMFLRRPGSTP